MLLDALFQIWRRLSGSLQWWFLWLISSKYMISVSGVIFDGEGRVLLQRHRHWVKDVWGLPGGIIEGRESLEEALTREVYEETGLRIHEIELLRIESGYKLRLEGYFRAKLIDDKQRMTIQEDEVLEARFFRLDELPENMLLLQREVIEQAIG